MASVMPVPPLPRQESRLGGTVPAGRSIEAATLVLRELVLTAASEQGWVATWVAGPGGLVTVSPASAGMLGLADGAAELGPAVAALLAPVLVAATGESWDAYDVETDAPGADGVLRRVRIRACSVSGHVGWTAGTIEPVATPTADIEDRYRLLLELSPDALIVHDAGVIVYTNPAAVAFARASSAADLLGQPILSFVAPESQPELLQRLAGLTAPGSVSQPSEAILLRLDGTSLVMEDLLRDADVAMYTAKQSGRSRAITFDAQLRSQTLHSLELEEDLRRAVHHGDISVAYQPLVDLVSGRTVATEALARWVHPVRGPMSPALFVPVAEETGLIGPLGSSVLADAVTRTAAWRAEGLSDLRGSR